jgi:hypothetical protein
MFQRRLFANLTEILQLDAFDDGPHLLKVATDRGTVPF